MQKNTLNAYQKTITGQADKNPITGQAETDENLQNIFIALAKTDETQEMSFFIFRHGTKGHGKALGHFYPVVAQAYHGASDVMKKCIYSHYNFEILINAAKKEDVQSLKRDFGLNNNQALDACQILATDAIKFTKKG